MEVVYTLLGILGGVVGSRLVTNYLTLRSGQYTLDKSKRKDALDECYELIERLQQERDEDRKRMEARIREIEKRLAIKDRQHSECEARYARAETRIEALEDTLKENNITIHRPWKSGTDTHKPYSPPDNTGESQLGDNSDSRPS